MTIRESIRAQRETIKNKSTREKLAYFWDYFGIKSICIIVVLSLSIYLIVDVVTQKDTGFVGVFFDASEHSPSDAYMKDFALFAGIDSEKYDTAVQLSPGIQLNGTITEEVYQTIEGFTTMVATKMVDNIAADTDLFLYFSYLGFTTDLRNLLSETQLSEISASLYYIDGDLLQQYQNKENTIDYNHFPDPKNPVDMVDPIPVGIDLSIATEAFRSTYKFTNNDAVIGICSTSERMQIAVAFINFSLGIA